MVVNLSKLSSVLIEHLVLKQKIMERGEVGHQMIISWRIEKNSAHIQIKIPWPVELMLIINNNEFAKVVFNLEIV